MTGDVLQALGGDAPSAGDDLEKRTDLRRCRGAAERDEQDGVDHRALSS
jgi:hypothetical protein